ncbi:MAG TPA: class I SAM-dependent methyltransferase [Anaerolineales bacterium]|nr:class I SAM-dependent methyltransferase [Anaerolineales bacterium]
MPDNKTVYAQHGNQYEALIAREDYQGNILSALQNITSLENRVILDLGAGTGRLACMLAPLVSRVYAFDIAPDMLRVCHEKLTQSGLSNWNVNIADHRQLPLGDHSADLIVSGWSVSYLAVWNPETWRTELEKSLAEMKRALRTGGTIVLFESLGTGNESPIRLDHLRNFYPWLDEAGFQNRWIRTDYKFESLEEAEYLARFFFGDELGDKVKRNNWVILPECTGIWWKKI